MTLRFLISRLTGMALQDPKILDKKIVIEHRSCDDDNPQDVGIYQYPDTVGLSFWKD